MADYGTPSTGAILFAGDTEEVFSGGTAISVPITNDGSELLSGGK